MGGKSKSKQEQKTSTTTNTTTTVGDIGLTGANAVDMAAVLETGSIQHDQIVGENLANLYQAAGSGYQQLIGGASDLIHTSQEATVKQQLIGLEQQTRNAEISLEQQTRNAETLREAMRSNQEATVKQQLIGLEQQTRNAEISLEQQTRNAETLRASMRSNQRALQSSQASQARNLQQLSGLFRTGQEANIKQQAANTEQQKMGFNKLGDLMKINREAAQRQSQMGIEAIEAGVKAVHPELTNEFNLNKALPYITAGIALMSLMNHQKG